MGFSAYATNITVRSASSICLLICWNHTNTDRSGEAVTPWMDSGRNDDFNTSKTSQAQKFFLSLERRKLMINSKFDIKILLISLQLLTLILDH